MKVHLLASGILPVLLASLPAQVMTIETVASGFSVPIAAMSPPGDYERIFVAERDGDVWIVREGQAPVLFKNIPGILAGGEQGLLGIAFHPDFQNQPYFYASFTDSSGDSSVDRWTVVGDGVQGGSRVSVIGPISQPFSNHNGGCIQFGPDGYLYYGLGDGGSGGDPGCRAQDGSTLLGKMLRLDVDNGLPAVAAPGNPFLGNPQVDGRIWAFGLRNPWRFSFDRQTGDMWIGDVGQNALEEINFQPGSSTGGENYGWKIKEGTNCFSTSGCSGVLPAPPVCASVSLVDPVRTLPTPSNNSVIGGYRYRGCAMPGRHGLYFHGNYSWTSAKIWTAVWNGSSLVSVVDRTAQLGNGGNLYSFGEDYNGEILICQGSQVNRVIPVGSITNNANLGPGSTGSNGLVPIYEVCGTLGTNNTATFRTRNAPPSAAGAVLFGAAANPVPLPLPGFGTLVPGIVLFTIPHNTDADGVASWSIADGTWPFNFVHQAAFLDFPLAGVTLSNAMETNFGDMAPPNVLGVAPLSAAPGATITVNGAAFSPSALILIDGVSPITPLTANATTITFSMPAGANCDATLTVRNPDLQTDSTPFNPQPVITSTQFDSGTQFGNQQFIINGTDFTAPMSVDIGGSAATVTNEGSTFIICTTPPGTLGVQPVTVSSPSGCFDTTSYTYN